MSRVPFAVLGLFAGLCSASADTGVWRVLHLRMAEEGDWDMRNREVVARVREAGPRGITAYTSNGILRLTWQHLEEEDADAVGRSAGWFRIEDARRFHDACSSTAVFVVTRRQADGSTNWLLQSRTFSGKGVLGSRGIQQDAPLHFIDDATVASTNGWWLAFRDVDGVGCPDTVELSHVAMWDEESPLCSLHVATTPCRVFSQESFRLYDSMQIPRGTGLAMLMPAWTNGPMGLSVAWMGRYYETVGETSLGLERSLRRVYGSNDIAELRGRLEKTTNLTARIPLHADLLRAGDDPEPHRQAIRQALDSTTPIVRLVAEGQLTWLAGPFAEFRPYLERLYQRGHFRVRDFLNRLGTVPGSSAAESVR